MNFAIDLLERGDLWHYDIITGVTWNEGEYSPPLLLSEGTNVTYTAPMASGVSFFERFGGERGGDLILTTQSTHFNVSAVPEPATYGMLFAGLGVVAFASRRRRPALFKQH